MGKKDKKKEPDRVLLAGKPDYERCDNKVLSARYTPLNFFPVVSRGLCVGRRVVYFYSIKCLILKSGTRKSAADNAHLRTFLTRAVVPAGPGGTVSTLCQCLLFVHWWYYVCRAVHRSL
jgi:hypothetical protein